MRSCVQARPEHRPLSSDRNQQPLVQVVDLANSNHPVPLLHVVRHELAQVVVGHYFRGQRRALVLVVVSPAEVVLFRVLHLLLEDISRVHLRQIAVVRNRVVELAQTLALAGVWEELVHVVAARSLGLEKILKELRV